VVLEVLRREPHSVLPPPGISLTSETCAGVSGGTIAVDALLVSVVVALKPVRVVA